MLGLIVEKTKCFADSAVTNINEIAEQMYLEVRGLKEHAVSFAPDVKKYVYPSNPFDTSMLVISAIPLAFYVSFPGAPIDAILPGLFFYALATPVRLEEYAERENSVTPLLKK